MWLYYVLILISVMMFGGGFALQDVFRKKRGSGLMISMEAAFIGSLAGLIVLLIINSFAFEFTWFTLLMAGWSALNGIAFTFCSFQALDRINLSLYSLFAMLGGMVLPFLHGWLFFSERMTAAKIVCVIFVSLSLLCTVKRGEKKKGVIFYAGVFVLNGMSGVISKIFTESTLPKASAAGYSVWIATMTVLLSGAVWLVLFLTKKRKGQDKPEAISKAQGAARLQSYGIGALQGTINKIANFLLVIALLHVDASVQYPMVTGGTIVVSTMISCFGKRKPDQREWISVGLAFLGVLLLFFIPF